MASMGDTHEIIYGGDDEHGDEGPGSAAEEEGDDAAAANADVNTAADHGGETTEISLVPRSAATAAQSKSSKKAKRRPGFKPQKKGKPKKSTPSSSNNINADDKAVDSAAVGGDVTTTETDEGNLKTSSPTTTAPQDCSSTSETQKNNVGDGDRNDDQQQQKPAAHERKDHEEALSVLVGESTDAVMPGDPVAGIVPIQRRPRSDSVASNATAASRRRGASAIRVGVSRGATGAGRNSSIRTGAALGVRFGPLPSSVATAVAPREGEVGDFVDATADQPSTEAEDYLEPTEQQQERLGEDAPPTPTSRALVAAAAAANNAADQAALHDREILEKLALEAVGQPKLGTFCSQFKLPKRKKDDDGTNTKKKRRKKRKKKQDDDNHQQSTENNENSDPATGNNVETSTFALTDEGGAIALGDINTDTQMRGLDGDNSAAFPAPVGIPTVHVVDGQIVLQESSLVLPVRRTIREVEEEFQDNIVEEDAQPAIVNASYSSFRTKRGATETVKKGPSIWSTKETYEFFQALRMLGTDFGAMEAMFDGTRTRRQLKFKYKRELARNPDLVEKLTDPRFKAEIDMSKFDVEVDPETILAHQNPDPPLYEPTDNVASDVNPEKVMDGQETTTEDNDGLGKEYSTGPNAAAEKEAPAFLPEEMGADYLEVVEEDAEEERLAAIEEARTKKQEKVPKTPGTRGANETSATKPSAKKASKKLAARKPVPRKHHGKSKAIAKEPDSAVARIQENPSAETVALAASTATGDVGVDLDMDSRGDQPLTNEGAQVTKNSVSGKHAANDSTSYDVAVATTDSTSGENASELTTNHSPLPVAKAATIQKKTATKAKRRRPRPLPVKGT